MQARSRSGQQPVRACGVKNASPTPDSDALLTSHARSDALLTPHRITSVSEKRSGIEKAGRIREDPTGFRKSARAQRARMFAACMPLGPRSASNSTFWFSRSSLKPEPVIAE